MEAVMRALTEIEATGIAGPELTGAPLTVAAPSPARLRAGQPGPGLVTMAPVIELERGSSPDRPGRSAQPRSQRHNAPAAPPRGVPARSARTPAAIVASRTEMQAAQAAPLRLTRRGRVVAGGLIVLVLTVAALVISLVASGGAQATNHGRPGAGYQGMHQIVVEPGESLFSIASAAEPTADPRNVVAQIMSVNDLTSTNLSVGEELWVPR
jgi:hypothetical protein